jgi:predicted metal-binding protein
LSDNSKTLPASPEAETRAPVQAATIFVCVTCRRKRADVPEGFDCPGEGLTRALQAEIARQGHAASLTVTPVACLAVCNRPCTVAFTGPGKWTHLVGGLDADLHMHDIVTAARQVAEAPDGIVPWAERPQAIRSGGIARVPPLGFDREA